MCLSLGLSLLAGAAFAADKNDTGPKIDGRYGSIVIDADTHKIIHARRIDDLRYPASLTKMMTIYLIFDALESGEITLQTQMPISKKAARTMPSKIWVRSGKTISVDVAIQALAVKSANDVAVVVAEFLGGSVDGFAHMMNAKARTLGMSKTVFKTPHGLPHPAQVTTARDMAKLADSLMRNHRRHYHYFGQTHFKYGKRTYKNTNGLLHWLEGVDGFKTGFTNASGYNLVTSAKRDNRRIIAVVLGGASGKSRDRHMADLINRSFKVIGVEREPMHVARLQPAPRPIPTPEPVVMSVASRDIRTISLRGSADTIARPLAQGSDTARDVIVIKGDTTGLTLPKTFNEAAFGVQVGAFNTEQEAREHLDDIRLITALSLSPNDGSVHQAKSRGRTIYRARIYGLPYEKATETCKSLESIRQACFVLAPKG